MFKNKRQLLEEKYTILFGRSRNSKQMIDFFVKRSLGEITEEEMNQSVQAIQDEFNYIFESFAPPDIEQKSNMGETIYGKLVSTDILDEPTKQAIEQ